MSPQAIEEIRCRDFVELVTDLIEGQLEQARRLEAESHAGDCPHCAEYLAQIRLTIVGLRALADSEDFPRTREQALVAFREIRSQTQDGGATP